ncbi:GNAT family N-acetyltransferase [Legionella gresilensis]|uniref:GNAT family N-acetyltransferase n=1 Tax=Legionella gresilensis TaxID=91823 RepID=UPI001040F198|nr:GNAT family N-acetyltransferase [Legionella gresilensis]
MKIFSEINTPRFVIRPMQLIDAIPYFEAEQASLKELAPHWSWAKADKSTNDIQIFIEESMQVNEMENPPEMYFSIFSREDYKFLGTIWLFEINWFVPHFEIAYWLDTRETGHGYMSEAVNALTRACFILYGAKRIQIKIATYNQKSNALAKKLGFQLEGEMRNFFINFTTQQISNGNLYSCINLEVLPELDIKIT